MLCALCWRHQAMQGANWVAWLHRNSIFAFCSHKSAYAGVATFCRTAVAQPLAAEEGITGTLPVQNEHLTADEGPQRIHFSTADTFWSRCAVGTLHAARMQCSSAGAASQVIRAVCAMHAGTAGRIWRS